MPEQRLNRTRDAYDDVREQAVEAQRRSEPPTGPPPPNTPTQGYPTRTSRFNAGGWD